MSPAALLNQVGKFSQQQRATASARDRGVTIVVTYDVVRWQKPWQIGVNYGPNCQRPQLFYYDYEKREEDRAVCEIRAIIHMFALLVSLREREKTTARLSFVALFSF